MSKDGNALLGIAETAHFLNMSRSNIKALLYRTGGGKFDFPRGTLHSGVRFWKQSELADYKKRAGIVSPSSDDKVTYITPRGFIAGKYADKLKRGEIVAVLWDDMHITAVSRALDKGYYNLSYTAPDGSQDVARSFCNRKLTVVHKDSSIVKESDSDE